MSATGLAWVRSSRCDGGSCVEVAWPAGAVAVRDNTVAQGHLTFDRASWDSLLAAVRTGQLDR